MERTPKYDSRWQYWSLVIMIYTALVAMGLVENGRSVGFTVVKQVYNVPYDTYGFFNSCLSFAYILFCFLASLVAEKINYKWILMIGYILIIVVCFTTLLTISFVSFGVCMFIVWMGFGFFEIGSNASSTIVFVEHQGTMMSLMHFFFGIGAVAGPNIARWSLTELKKGYYSIYLSLGIVVLILFIFSVFLPFRLPRVESGKEVKPTLTVFQALRLPSVWLCSITMGMMQTIESSGASWAPLYLVDVLGFDVETDVANFTTALYAIFTISRLISGPMIDKMGYYCYLYICLGACFILLAIGFCIGRKGVILFALTGFFYSATWPVFICVIMGYYKENAATVTSVVIVLQGVMLLPMNTILGWLNEHWGKHWAYQLTLLFCVVGAALLSCVYYSQKHYEERIKRELPISVDEKKELPISVDEKKESTISIEEKKELPISVDEKKELPITIDEKKESTINVDEKKESTLTVEEKNQL